MYTEICHFLLLYAVFSASLWLLYFPLFTLGSSLSILSHLNSNKTHKKNNIEDFSDVKIQSHGSEMVLILKGLKKKKDLSAKRKIINNSQKVRKTASYWIKELISFRVLFSSFFFLLSISFFGTISNYICSDFSIYNTTTNSTSDIPLFYKISATWSNHEGSLLLWCWLLSFNAFLFSISISSINIGSLAHLNFASVRFAPRQGPAQARSASQQSFKKQQSLDQKSFAPIRFFYYTDNELSSASVYKNSNHFFSESKTLAPRFNSKSFHKIRSFQQSLKAYWITFFSSTYILDQSRKKFLFLLGKTTFLASILVLFFITFCIMTSNPFLRTSNPSINSLAELNPILQDPVLAIHPPCIYIGYVASAIAFSLCMYHLPVHFAPSSKTSLSDSPLGL